MQEARFLVSGFITYKKIQHRNNIYLNSPTSFDPPKLYESSLSGIVGLVRPAERLALLLPPPPLSTRPDSETFSKSDKRRCQFLFIYLGGFISSIAVASNFQLRILFRHTGVTPKRARWTKRSIL